MTEPATTPPASYCPHAAHTLQWGLHPDSTTQGWILRDGSSVVAVLDGYPHGRTPVLAGEAREWADRILGTAREWVEQPARSGAYHRHGTVAAAPVAAPPTGQAGLREKIAEALMAWAERNNSPLYARTRRSETVRANAYSRADAVLSMLFGPIPAGTDTATWTAIRAIQLMNEAGQQRDAASAEPDRLRAVVARLRQMTDHWEQQLPEVIRTPAVVSAIRAALERADDPNPAAGTPQPRRGDQFERWLKAQRDEYEVRSSPQWGALDEVLDTYRLHADTGTPLGEHVCEGQAVGDCDCMETPAFEADRDSKTSPKVDSKAEPVHARPGPDDNGISPCCARPPFEFRGERLTRDPAKVTCIAAAVTLPGKEA